MLPIAKTTILIPWVLALTAAARAATTQPSVPFTLSPQTTSITAPLRPDGTVDYVAALNQRFSDGVTPQNNGFVLWLRVMGYDGVPQSTGKAMAKACGAEPLTPADTGFTPYSRNTPIERGDPHLWKESDDPAYAAFLKSNEDLFALVTQAAARPRWWEPSVSANGSMLMILLPELNIMRGVSLDLCNRALLRAQQGDFDGFLSDVMTAKRLARGAACGFLVGDLVSKGIDVLVDRAISASAGAGIFSSDQCARLTAALDTLEPATPVWQTMGLGERWGALDWAESIATGNLDRLSEGSAPNGDRWIRIFKTVDRDSVDWNAVLRLINSAYDQIIQTMKIPAVKDRQIARRDFDRKYAKVRANSSVHTRLAKQPDETNQAYTQRVTDGILSVLLPTVWRADDTCRNGDMEGKMVRTVIAAAQYRADKGQWPTRLEDLTPQYLPEIPRDLFYIDGTRPIRYQRTRGGISLHAHLVSGGDITQGAP